MADVKHTPGPWTIHADADHPAAGEKYAQYTIEPYVCEVFYTNEKGKANANLIAAAPELLEALQELFGADMEHVLMGDGKDDQVAAIAKAHAAIAKATGAARATEGGV